MRPIVVMVYDKNSFLMDETKLVRGSFPPVKFLVFISWHSVITATLLSFTAALFPIHNSWPAQRLRLGVRVLYLSS
jgi:hypothetical protein